MKARRRKRPKLGQHFLAHSGLRQRIANLLACQPSDCWLEIGAGHGEMTTLLAARTACVLAVETDGQLIATLRERFRDSPHVHPIHANILNLSLAELAARYASLCPERDGSELRVYGNLPYYITSPILRHLFAQLDTIRDIFVVVQREVAARLVAKAGRRDFGYLSAITQFYTTPTLLLRLPSSAFHPPPRVHSALVRLEPSGYLPNLSPAQADAFLHFLGNCFRQKRKTLFNNLRGVFPAEQVQAVLTEHGHTLQTRAEALGVEELLEIFGALCSLHRRWSSPNASAGR